MIKQHNPLLLSRLNHITGNCERVIVLIVHMAEQAHEIQTAGSGRVVHQKSFELRCLVRSCALMMPSSASVVFKDKFLRVQVPKYRIYSQNHYYDSYYRNHIYLIFGYFGPSGSVLWPELLGQTRLRHGCSPRHLG